MSAQKNFSSKTHTSSSKTDGRSDAPVAPSFSVECPDSLVGLFIGKGGANVQEFTKKTGVSARITCRNGRAEVYCPKSAIPTLRDALTAHLEELKGSLIAEFEIPCDDSMAGLIIGHQGSRIRALSKEFAGERGRVMIKDGVLHASCPQRFLKTFKQALEDRVYGLTQALQQPRVEKSVPFPARFSHRFFKNAHLIAQLSHLHPSVRYHGPEQEGARDQMGSVVVSDLDEAMVDHLCENVVDMIQFFSQEEEREHQERDERLAEQRQKALSMDNFPSLQSAAPRRAASRPSSDSASRSSVSFRDSSQPSYASRARASELSA